MIGLSGNNDGQGWQEESGVDMGDGIFEKGLEPPVLWSMAFVGSLAPGTLCQFYCHAVHVKKNPPTKTQGLPRGGGGGGGRSGRQKAATRRNMRREEWVTVQGPVKEQQPDGMPHRGGGGTPCPLGPPPLFKENSAGPLLITRHH